MRFLFTDFNIQEPPPLNHPHQQDFWRLFEQGMPTEAIYLVMSRLGKKASNCIP